MKRIFSLIITFICFFGFAQNVNQEVNPETIVPQLFQFKFPHFPEAQRVSTEDVFLTSQNWNKYKKINWSISSKYEVKYKNKDVYYGELDYDGDFYHRGRYTLTNGTMKFHNGDVFIGKFHNGAPERGEYTFANGDKATISTTGEWQSHELIYKYTLINGDKCQWNTQIRAGEYQYANGSIYNFRYGMSGGTSLQTKEGYLYEGYLDSGKPKGEWIIKDENGTYFLFFEEQGFGGFVPFKKEDGTISWRFFENNKFIKEVKMLFTGSFCMTGDCNNEDSAFFVGEDPEYKLNAVFGGKFKNGVPIGDFRTFILDHAGNKKFELVGPIKDYKFHGNCTKVSLEKNISFTGEYQNGLPQKGNLIVDGNLIEVTSFKNRKIIGKQVFPRSEQRMYSRYYEGEFNQNGQIEGAGTVYITDNNHWGYEGCKITATNWKNGYSGDCCFIQKNGNEDCQRVYFVDKSDFPDFNFSHPISLRNLAQYQQQKEQERASQEAANNKNQNEYQCGQCNGLGVIKTQCPMCHGAGYRKDMVTYDKYTGNTGGPAKCGHCGGTGQYTVMGCSKCDGKGFVRK
jgi:hypothetical protein